MDYYTIPASSNWLKSNLKIIIGNKDLAEIMQFGDLWRSRGHIPLVHVVSPAMDNGKMWDNHKDPSGLLDNIPEHIDLLITDFYNRDNPKLPKSWSILKSDPKWLIWEYESGKFRFNGTYKQFVDLFGVDPAQQSAETTPAPPAETTNTGGFIHLQCPHCGKKIF